MGYWEFWAGSSCKEMQRRVRRRLCVLGSTLGCCCNLGCILHSTEILFKYVLNVSELLLQLWKMVLLFYAKLCCFIENKMFKIFCLIWNNLGKMVITITGSFCSKHLCANARCHHFSGHYYTLEIQYSALEANEIPTIVP